MPLTLPHGLSERRRPLQLVHQRLVVERLGHEGGLPYLYDTQEAAIEMLEKLYPDMCRDNIRAFKVDVNE